MSDLAATNCGCGCGCEGGNNTLFLFLSFYSAVVEITDAVVEETMAVVARAFFGF